MRFLRPIKCCVFRSCVNLRLVVLIALVSLTLIAIIVHILSISTTLYCLNFKTKNAIKNLCDNYEAGQVAGNLCEDLCRGSSHFAIASCYIPHLAKDVVFTARWRRRTVVVKARHGDAAAYDPFPGHLGQPSPQRFLAILKEIVMVHFESNFGGQHLLREDGFISDLLPGYLHGWTAESDRELQVVFRSIWQLTQQKEYLTFRLFRDSGLFPNVSGSCGHFYATEHVTPAATFLRAGWDKRAGIALGILQALEVAEYRFPFPLRICDMKLNHFGMDSDQGVKLLDGDDLYFQDVLNKIVRFDGICHTNRDCTFFDCDMACDTRNRTCDTLEVNTNLQAACRKLFSHSHSLSPGLLHSPDQQIKIPLDDVLKACIASTNADFAFFKLKNVIESLLRSSD